MHRIRCSTLYAVILGSQLVGLRLGPATIARAQVTPETASADQRAFARAAYQAGLGEFQRGEYARAADHFAAADAEVSSPNTKLMYGRSLRRLGRGPEAARVLRAAVREAGDHELGRYEQARAASLEELAELRRELGWLRIGLPGEADPPRLLVNGSEIGAGELDEEIPVVPGTVAIRTERGGSIRQREIAIAAGAEVVIDLEDEPAPPLPAASPPARVFASIPARPADPPGDLRTISYFAGGAGVAGLVAFGVLGLMSAGEFDELQDACPSKRNCDPALERVASRGDTYQTAANVSLAIGLAGLGAGVALFLADRSEAHRSDAPVTGDQPSAGAAAARPFRRGSAHASNRGLSAGVRYRIGPAGLQGTF